MPYSPEHPSDWTLELLADGALPPDEHATVAAHVEGCAHCTAELESCRQLFSAIENLPAFTPSPVFAEAVMARVTIKPKTAAAWITDWLPATRRGWTILLGICIAPALPMIAALIWLMTNPLVTPSALWEVSSDWVRDAAWSALVITVGTAVDSGLLGWGRAAWDSLLEVPLEFLVGGVVLLAIAMPLSVWTLYRTLRTPRRGTVYAH